MALLGIVLLLRTTLDAGVMNVPMVCEVLTPDYSPVLESLSNHLLHLPCSPLDVLKHSSTELTHAHPAISCEIDVHVLHNGPSSGRKGV